MKKLNLILLISIILIFILIAITQYVLYSQTKKIMSQNEEIYYLLENPQWELEVVE